VHAIKTKISQSIEALISDQIDTAPIATISAIGSTSGDIFFAPKTDTAIAAIARLDPNGCLIYKFHNGSEYSIQMVSWKMDHKKKAPIPEPLFSHEMTSPLCGINAHKLAAFRAFNLESDYTVALCKQRVIFTATDIYSRVEVRTTLADQNITGDDALATKTLDT